MVLGYLKNYGEFGQRLKDLGDRGRAMPYENKEKVSKSKRMNHEHIVINLNNEDMLIHSCTVRSRGMCINFYWQGALYRHKSA